MTAPDVARLDRVLAGGGVAVVPTDTVYGLACALDVPGAVERLYDVKGRDRGQPCQVLAYDRDLVTDALSAVDAATRDVVTALLPGTVTCIVPDPSRRFAAAAGSAVGSVGIRVPVMPSAYTAVRRLLVATSANAPGGPSPAEVADVPSGIVERADMVVDAGRLPGTASSVLDLTDPASGARVLRAGPDMDDLRSRLERLGVALRP